MNKKLRRILRHRRTNNTEDTTTTKKQRDLTALLGEREKAEPNYYLSNDQNSNNKNSDEKEPKGEDLIVNTDPVACDKADIEISLEAVKAEAVARNPSVSEATREAPNATDVPRSAESALDSRREASAAPRNEAKHTKWMLHNRSPRPDSTECSIMQHDRLAIAFGRGAHCDNTFEEERSWDRCQRRDCGAFAHSCDSDFEMKRTRDACDDRLFSQREADWGWVTLPRAEDNRPDDCSCCNPATNFHPRCTMTSQRGRDRWSPWKTCRCAATPPCRGRRHSCCAARCGLDNTNGSRTLGQARRFQTSTAVLFTIVDEDALERRPRVLEFGRTRVAKQTLPPHRHHHHHHRAHNAHRCHGDCACCDGVALRSDGMDWNEDYEDTTGSHNSSHCFAAATNNTCLQHHHVNGLVTSPTASLSGMAPSIGFFSGAESSPVITQQASANLCHCPCRARSVTSRSMTSQHGCFDKRLSDDAWTGRAGNGFDPSTSLEHFELSKRAYARLIAYCHSKKLLSDIYTNPDPDDAQCDFVSTSGSSGSDDTNSPSSSSAGFGDLNSGGSDFISTSAFDSARTLCHLAQVFETVDECPWYCGAMTGQEAKMRLRGTPPGTFLLRDSSDSRFLFSMSLMTRRGATSIRIVYANGRFGFDSEQDDAPSRKSSSSSSHRSRSERTKCVVRMILHYTSALASKRLSSSESSKDASTPTGGSERSTNGATKSASEHKRQFVCYSMDRGTRKEIPIQLVQPVSGGVMSLQQISRACLNRRYRLWEKPEMISRLPLPFVLKNYVRKYPYPI